MRIRTYAVLTACAFSLSACTTTQTQMPSVSTAAVESEALKQRAMAFERDERFMVRLRNVAFPILEANAELCDDRLRHEFGFLAGDRSQYARAFRDGFEQRYGSAKRPRITIVTRNTPAFAAGLVRGHEVLKVNGEETREGGGSSQRLKRVVRKAERDMTPLTLTVAKDGVAREVTLNGTTLCDYGIQIQEDNIINAFADGDNIIFTVGMMRFAETDEELATVVGHEIAHNVMDHLASKQTAAIIGGLFGALLDTAAALDGANTDGFYTNLGTSLGTGLFSVEKEQEADYVGLYMMERGGFDSTDVASFWRRMGAENPGAIERSGMPFLDTHPAPPERFLALEAIHEEIVNKRAAGEPLVPNMKTGTMGDGKD